MMLKISPAKKVLNPDDFMPLSLEVVKVWNSFVLYFKRNIYRRHEISLILKVLLCHTDD